MKQFNRLKRNNLIDSREESCPICTQTWTRIGVRVPIIKVKLHFKVCFHFDC